MIPTGHEWQKHHIMTGLDAPCVLGVDDFNRGFFKDPRGTGGDWCSSGGD